MITTHQEFEKALENAVGYLESPPAAGTAEHQHFMTLLEHLAAYKPKISMPEKKSPEETKLEADLKAFEEKMPAEVNSHWHTLVSEI